MYPCSWCTMIFISWAGTSLVKRGWNTWGKNVGFETDFDTVAFDPWADERRLACLSRSNHVEDDESHSGFFPWKPGAWILRDQLQKSLWNAWRAISWQISSYNHSLFRCGCFLLPLKLARFQSSLVCSFSLNEFMNKLSLTRNDWYTEGIWYRNFAAFKQEVIKIAVLTKLSKAFAFEAHQTRRKWIVIIKLF